MTTFRTTCFALLELGVCLRALTAVENLLALWVRTCLTFILDKFVTVLGAICRCAHLAACFTLLEDRLWFTIPTVEFPIADRTCLRVLKSVLTMNIAHLLSSVRIGTRTHSIAVLAISKLGVLLTFTLCQNLATLWVGAQLLANW